MFYPSFPGVPWVSKDFRAHSTTFSCFTVLRTHETWLLPKYGRDKIDHIPTFSKIVSSRRILFTCNCITDLFPLMIKKVMLASCSFWKQGLNIFQFKWLILYLRWPDNMKPKVRWLSLNIFLPITHLHFPFKLK